MKKVRAIIYILLFIIGATLLIMFISNLINGAIDNTPKEATNQTTETPATNTEAAPVTPTDSAIKTSPETNNQPAIDQSNLPEVTTVKLGELKNTYFEATGAVKSKGIVSLFPQTSAAVKKVNFEEGDYVKEGDVIIELTGANLTEHQSETQLKIAQTNLANAQESYNNLQKTSAESLKTASLQLQTAVNQATAIAYDLAVIEQNKTGLEDSLRILRDSLSNTVEKNNRDLENTAESIDELVTTLNEAQSDRARTKDKINELQDTIEATPATDSNGAPNPALAPLQEQLAKLQEALKAQDKGIEDLYDAIDKARYGYQSAQNGVELSENQVLAQIQQSQNQAKVLDLNLLSTQTKLGYSGDTSDALLLAQQGYNATKIQLQTAMDNAANQLKLAQLNVDLAKSQASSLQIKAPFTGVITSLDLSLGQLVSPQVAVAEVIDPKSFQLEVGVDPYTADRITAGQPAEMILAGRTIELPVKSVSPKVDEKTKLVNVTLQLPNIFFKINQTFSVRLPLVSGATVTGSTFLPLDAVTIGTESQFVYIVENGKTKKVAVKIGEIAGDQVEILEGIPANAEVVLSGAKDLADGQEVKVVNQ